MPARKLEHFQGIGCRRGYNGPRSVKRLDVRASPLGDSLAHANGVFDSVQEFAQDQFPRARQRVSCFGQREHAARFIDKVRALAVCGPFADVVLTGA